MNLPSAYRWLQQQSEPRHLLKAIELYGTTEVVGSRHNPVIMGWAKETGLQSIYTSDEVPWCGLFMAVVMHRAGRPVVANPLRALAWNSFGVQVSKAALADVLTFTRQGGGHVGLYVGEDSAAYHVLGGNQGNKVSIVRIAKSRLSQIRRPAYNNQPSNVQPIILAANGALSTNEA